MNNELDSLVKEFFICSLRSDFEDFDFEEAFSTFLPDFEYQVGYHGQGSFEDFTIAHEYHLDGMICALEPWAVETCLMHVRAEDLALEAMRALYEASKECYESSHHEVKEIYLELCDPPCQDQNLAACITLFDRCIHCQHVGGSVLQDLDDPDSLRKDAEKQYRESIYDNPELI